MSRKLYTDYQVMATETIESSYDNPNYRCSKFKIFQLKLGIGLGLGLDSMLMTIM